MEDKIRDWILNSWTGAKNQYENSDEKNKLKKLEILAKSLRLFVNQVRTKSGIPQDYKQIAAQMAQFIEQEIVEYGWENSQDAGIVYFVTLTTQYCRKHLGNTAIQGSAVKGKLSRADRARVRKLAKTNKPAPGPVEPKLAQDHVNGDDVQSGGVVDDFT